MTDGIVHVRHFICKHCDSEVHLYGAVAANDEDICSLCAFLLAIEDPSEADEIARLLDHNFRR